MSRLSFHCLPPLFFALAGSLTASGAFAVDYPITPGQRSTAQQVAQAGVPLSELSPNAPDSYTIKKGDTLWDISKLFLKSPWRWPELWGMNMEQIHNPHLIYPGQVLFLDKSNGRARLTLGRPVGNEEKLSPRVRSEPLITDAISSVPMHLIGPFLNDAVVFETNQLELSPQIVATQEGRVLLSRGETAYVKGDVDAARNWQLFREPKPLTDPETGEILGFEARHVGTAELIAKPDVSSLTSADEIAPSVFRINTLREEANVGDHLAPLPPRDTSPFAPHAPSNGLKGRIIAVYGDGLNAGQNQIVSLNRGLRDGVERGHVLALWRAGTRRPDPTDKSKMLVLPDERHGLLFVFRVFERVSYALILQVQDPVHSGDKFTQP
ncbi:LysM peptidoglycan-binding domain-containing protein [Ideonella azotifigens]|uniref:LysM domain-containing protein n=1 Tax=Ideonella azotifigens TaxID=513160 RepID=A0ABN1K9K8_9BURK|nr:LysM peptidoglycan-binding domain-containing protein [Ideonella azotifigens]MCD2339020.1 LysM peptidoglycan-binding domain-containing protein [Ideonella azotifigens]